MVERTIHPGFVSRKAFTSWSVICADIACYLPILQCYSVLTFRPLYERGDGGFRGGCLRQIPPHPPLAKGGTGPRHRKLNGPAVLDVPGALDHKGQTWAKSVH